MFNSPLFSYSYLCSYVSGAWEYGWSLIWYQLIPAFLNSLQMFHWEVEWWSLKWLVVMTVCSFLLLTSLVLHKSPWMDGVSSNLLKIRSIPIPPLPGCPLWKCPYLTAALYIPQWHIAVSKNNLTFKGLILDNIEKIQTFLKMIPGDLFNDLHSGRIEYPQQRTLKATEIVWRHLA